MPDAPGIPIRIEAAGYQGKPVSFTTIYPWTRQERMAQTPSTPYGKVLNVLGTALIVILVAGPAFFARQNLRLGRGDRRGANRMVTALILGPFTVTWILLEQHVATFWELELFVEFLARTMLFGGLFWTLYIAIEPFVRRRWPHILISWTRLLAGEWRDPLVGRDVLIGCVAAIAQWSVAPFGVVLATWFGRPQTALMTPSNPDIVLGTSYFIGLRSVDMAITILLALVATFIFLLARTLFRRDWLAVAVTLLVLTIPDSNILAVAGPWSSTAMYMIGAAIMVFVQMRFGLVAFAATFVVASIFSTTPVTFQNSWYAGYGYAALLIIAALALYGFKTSLGGRPALSFSALDVEPGPRSTGS
jgi:serine/threonine-protein kinase